MLKGINEFPKQVKVKKDVSLRFIEPTFENAKEVYELIVKNRKHLLPWLPFASEEITKAKEDSFRVLDRVAEEWNAQTKKDFGIYFEDKLIGKFGFFNINSKTRACEIGYWLDKDFTHQGIMSGCVRAVEKLLFEQYGFNRILIKCDKRNEASANVPKACGFTLEGELREDRLAFDGTIESTLMFSKLKREYK